MKETEQTLLDQIKDQVAPPITSKDNIRNTLMQKYGIINIKLYNPFKR